MKALTVCQPYAHLISRGLKPIENRDWPTFYRGPLYIHAGKSKQWLNLSDDGTRDESYGIPLASMAFGAVVAIARLVDCLHIARVRHGEFDTQYPQIRTHDHTNGPWCWVLANISPIGPWPWRGSQGLFDINDDELNRVANRELGISESNPT